MICNWLFSALGRMRNLYIFIAMPFRTNWCNIDHPWKQWLINNWLRMFILIFEQTIKMCQVRRLIFWYTSNIETSTHNILWFHDCIFVIINLKWNNVAMLGVGQVLGFQELFDLAHFISQVIRSRYSVDMSETKIHKMNIWNVFPCTKGSQQCDCVEISQMTCKDGKDCPQSSVCLPQWLSGRSCQWRLAGWDICLTPQNYHNCNQIYNCRSTWI